MTTRWPVRHPGIGVLYYDSEHEARVAAGTAGELLPPSEDVAWVSGPPNAFRSAVADLPEISAADIEILVRRLEAAELVCNLVGICGSASNSDRDKALTQAWMDWSHAYRDRHVKPADLPIAELAARRDEIRSRTLARIRGEVDG